MNVKCNSCQNWGSNGTGGKEPLHQDFRKIVLISAFAAFFLFLFDLFVLILFIGVLFGSAGMFYLLTNGMSSRFWRTSLTPPWLLNRSFMSSRPRGSRKCGQIMHSLTHIYFVNVFATAPQWWKRLLNIFRITRIVSVMWLGCTLLQNKSPKLMYLTSPFFILQ